MDTTKQFQQESKTPPDESPLRAELFSATQMANHGRYLAGLHQLSLKRHPERLLGRLAHNVQLIGDTCTELAAALDANRGVTPAAECLLDHRYLIEQAVRTVRRQLSASASGALPRMVNEVARVYQVAEELVAHGDGRIDHDSLAGLVDAYQESVPFTLGELRAIPSVLRLALIENLRRVAAQIRVNRAERERASTWAATMAATAEQSPSKLVVVVAEMATSGQAMSCAFVAELARRLQGQGPALAPALQWIGIRLGESGLTIEQQVAAEIAQQAANQVSISNSVASLRLLGAIDWDDFLETRSAVEHTLRRDPAGVYPQMDGATRAHYRHLVAQLAARSRHTELQVAEQALEIATENRALSEGGLDARTRHIGYYLAGKGAPRLEQRVDARVPPRLALGRLLQRAPLAGYLVAIGGFTLLFAAAGISIARADAMPLAWLVLLGVLLLIGASQLAHALVDYLVARHVEARPLPRMDYSAGVPDAARTLVVVPAQIYNPDNAAALCEAMEVRYLANRDPNIRFCLLGDFADAAQQHLPGDDVLLEQLRGRIDALNARYRFEAQLNTLNDEGEVEKTTQMVEPFVLLHRPRAWNAAEGLWMGQERKRGKLAALHAFLHGGVRDAFVAVAGGTQGLSEVRYVITLDTHTQLPRDCARQLVACMDHPLNRPQLDMKTRRVVDGHGVLQPRVAAALPGEHASLYELLRGGDAGSGAGIDAHTGVVADVYQNLFEEGSFVGAGIYDVDTFETVLNGRLPQQQILSHDLLEGCYLRAGLLAHTELYEAAPARYSDDVSRRHRWTRGDWQLAGWLRPSVPGRAGQREPNPLSRLSRWKLFDNLRRSLVAPSLALLLILCWSTSPSPLFWTLAVLAVFLLPVLVSLCGEALDKPHATPWPQHLRALGISARTLFSHAALAVACLAHEAYVAVDAIVRAVWRLTVTRRRLLEWRPDWLAHPSTDLLANWRSMAASPLLALGAGLLVWTVNPPALKVAAPLLALWLIAPAIAWAISVPLRRKQAAIHPQQLQFLQAVARKTWHYFDSFAGPDNNWLAPDQLQEQAPQMLAQRTSPAGIGLALLARLSAWDFGFLTTARVIEQTDAALRSLERMERYRGHFYQSYDTRTLDPIQPLYVSSQESGALAGHLLTLATGLSALADEPIATPQTFEGIAITLRVVDEHAQGAPQEAKDAILQMHIELQAKDLGALPQVTGALTRLNDLAQALVAALAADADPLLLEWAGKLADHCRSALAELLELAPWMRAAPQELVDSSLTRMPNLRELAGFTLAASADSDLAPSERERLALLGNLVAQGSARAAARLQQLDGLVAKAQAMATMDMGFLYKRSTRLLALGYHVRERRLDADCHELLASSARLGSFVAIAQGQLPQEHWFAMGRQLCLAGGRRMLVSHSGALHDYLMPLVVMPAYRDTLLERSYHAVVKAQIAHGRARQLPWGMAQSAYHTVDAAQNYESRAFGVPGTGLARAGDDMVVAPYAAMLALMVEPAAACANLRRLADLGVLGPYGFYEALDYTPARLAHDQPFALIRAFVAQHQGMGLLAISHLLHDRPMQRRFEADPQLQAALLVLQERMPREPGIELAAGGAPAGQSRSAAMPARVITQTTTAHPEAHLLSNGRYHVMVTGAGGGYSRWRDTAVTRWSADATCDRDGSCAYLRDLDSGEFWSNAYQPTLDEPDHYEAVFVEGRATLRRRDRDIDLSTDIVVAPDDDIELRRIRVANSGATPRMLELTTYLEAATVGATEVASPAPAAMHLLPAQNAILCAGAADNAPWLLHMATLHGDSAEVSFATSREAFIGRAGSTALPLALTGSAPLTGADGQVPDPILAVRHRFTLAPGQSVVIDAVTGMAASRAAAEQLAGKYRDRQLCERVFELAWTHSQVLLRQHGASEADAQLYASLAGSVIYPNPALRAEAAILLRNRRPLSGLRAYGISGAHPLVLLQMRDPANIALARQVLQAHAYWREKGLRTDLMIWYEDQPGRREALREQIAALVDKYGGSAGGKGAVALRLVDQIPEEDRVLMLSHARVIVSDARGALSDQIHPTVLAAPRIPLLEVQPGASWQSSNAAMPPRRLILNNGIGGFTPDGLEYIIRTGGETQPPAAWVNLLANPQFACRVSESGQACSRSPGADGVQLTGDAQVLGHGGEVFYIRDEESGKVWSPTAAPIGASGEGEYVTRHGFGYSVFEHVREGVSSELTMFVALDAPLKYAVLRLRNDSSAPRTLSATGYVDWVLGDARADSAMHIVTELDPDCGALFARNLSGDSARVAFFHADGASRSVSADRTEFIGRNGTLALPAALGRTRLSGRVGAGLDPCGAVQVGLTLQPGEAREVVFVLGAGKRRSADTSAIVNAAKGIVAAVSALDKLRHYWAATLSQLRIETPDPSLDALVNGWLLYQSMCGSWAAGEDEGAAAIPVTLEQAVAAARAGDSARAWELVRQINPARRELALYRHEPYVMSDENGWNLAAAQALYRLIVGALLGLSVDGQRLMLAPRLPAEWPGVRIDYRYRDTMYVIAVSRGAQPMISVDGVWVEGGVIEMRDGAATRHVDVVVALAP